MQLRPFEDLIKIIEYDGETFVPIEEIARIEFNNIIHPDKIISKISIEAKPIKNKSSFLCATAIINFGNRELYDISIMEKNYSCSCYSIIGLRLMIVLENQVQIVKNLIKWGFVEP